MQIRQLICLSALLNVFSAVNAQENSFILPQIPGLTGDYHENEVFQVGSTIKLQWHTNYDSITLYWWQNGNNTPVVLWDNASPVQFVNWTIDLTNDFSLSVANVFFFQLYNGSSDTFFSSHYFNLTHNSVATTTSASTSSSRTSSPDTGTSIRAGTADIASATTTSANPSSPTPTLASISAAPATDSGLSTGAKTGIGIGVAVGVAGLLAGIIVALVFRRRHRAATGASSKAVGGGALDGLDGTSQQQRPSHPPLSEMGENNYYDSGSNKPYQDGSAYGPTKSAYQTETRPLQELDNNAAVHEMGGHEARSELG